MASSENIVYSKGKIGGMAFRAPIGTAVPIDATTALHASFEDVGHISEDGLKRSSSFNVDEVKSWDGTIVSASDLDKKEELKFKMIEALNPLVQKTIRGDTNVEGAITTGLKIRSNTKDLEPHSWVFEEILTGNIAKRTVVPNGKITSIAEVSENGKEITGYEVTLLAMPDADGNSVHEYYYGG